MDVKTNTWYEGPSPDSTFGLIWLGHAAHELNNTLPPCIHRVVNPDAIGTPRLSLWMELCTYDQILAKFDAHYNPETHKAVVINVRKREEVELVGDLASALFQLERYFLFFPKFVCHN